MQTFLPSSNISYTAKSLDNKRLNKQILEGYQILKVLSGESISGAWRNHPAVLMWKGYETGLWSYIQHMIKEAKVRGIKTINNENNLNDLKAKCSGRWGKTPPSFWLNDNKVMRITTTHKANLFKKDPIYYIKYQYAESSPYNVPCCPERKVPCQYYWPTHEERNELLDAIL